MIAVVPPGALFWATMITFNAARRDHRDVDRCRAPGTASPIRMTGATYGLRLAATAKPRSTDRSTSWLSSTERVVRRPELRGVVNPRRINLGEVSGSEDVAKVGRQCGCRYPLSRQ
jgi:hypothetical protein